MEEGYARTPIVSGSAGGRCPGAHPDRGRQDAAPLWNTHHRHNFRCGGNWRQLGHWRSHHLPQRYSFAVQGLEVGGVGVSKVQAVGQVYHLLKVEDVVGTYVAVGADAAVGGGAWILTMRNQHGVVINLQSVQQGIKLPAGVEGITIAWKGRRGRT